MKKKILNVLIVLFALVFIISGIKFATEYYNLHKEDNAFKQLQQDRDIQGKTAKNKKNPNFAKNSDMIAWLTVDGTYIDYPIMHTPDDPEFYLHADFEKNYSYSGTPFMDGRCDLDSDNMVIYGHNMLNGTMFSTLSNYDNKEFYDKYGTFALETREGVREYRVIAAFKTDVKTATPIYNFIHAKDETDFLKFVEEIKGMSLYDTGYTAAYGEQLCTLSTCAYHVENGRFIIIGKRIK